MAVGWFIWPHPEWCPSICRCPWRQKLRSRAGRINSPFCWVSVDPEESCAWEGTGAGGSSASSALGQVGHCPNPRFGQEFAAFPGCPLGEQELVLLCPISDCPWELPWSQGPFRVSVSEPQFISRLLKLFPRCSVPQIGAELSHRVFLLVIYNNWKLFINKYILFKGKKPNPFPVCSSPVILSRIPIPLIQRCIQSS